MKVKLASVKLSEAQIQQTCCEFLALDGWRRVRTDMKQLRGMGVQEPGMADDLFIRYMLSGAPRVFYVDFRGQIRVQSVVP